MMVSIERMDKKPDPRFDEIQQDWRAWASRNGYTKIESIAVEQNAMNVSLEVLGNPAQEDAYLLYVPSLPRTTGGETLYIIGNQEQLIFLVDAIKKMVGAAMVITQEKLSIRKLRLN